MKKPANDFEALREDLRNVYDGDPWHGSSIVTVLSGVDAKTAALRCVPKAHTIWELVLHMSGWTREVTSRARGAAPKAPPEDWPVPKIKGGEIAWQAARDDLRDAHRELEQVVASLTPEDLMRPIGTERDAALGTGYTLGTLLRGLLEHHTYHEGQIAILKRAAETF
jgi:uncharacterized damage-inducible protein DinB